MLFYNNVPIVVLDLSPLEIWRSKFHTSLFVCCCIQRQHKKAFCSFFLFINQSVFFFIFSLILLNIPHLDRHYLSNSQNNNKTIKPVLIGDNHYNTCTTLSRSDASDVTGLISSGNFPNERGIHKTQITQLTFGWT